MSNLEKPSPAANPQAETPTELQELLKVSTPETAPLLLGRAKYEIKEKLFAMNKNDKDEEFLDGKIGQDLNTIQTDLIELQIRFPNDKDLPILNTMYRDLQADFKYNRSLDLDSSFETIMTGMQKVIEASGVHKETAKQSVMADTIKKLEDCGIHPEYVLTKGNPEAKTVVYFMQVHPQDGMSQKFQEEIGATYSQKQILQAIQNSVKKNLVQDVYGEGIPDGEEISLKQAQKDSSGLAYLQAKTRLQDKVKIKGIEDVSLLAETIFTGREKPESFIYRMTAHNVLIASNIAQQLQNSDQNLAFVVLGAAHEKNFFSEEPHPLPFSQALAYYDMNVIVVDTSQHFDMGKILKHQAEVQKAMGSLEEKGIKLKKKL